jgi:hypothetical protein
MRKGKIYPPIGLYGGLSSLAPTIARLTKYYTRFYQLKIPKVGQSPQGDPIWTWDGSDDVPGSGTFGPPNVLVGDVPTTPVGSPNSTFIPAIVIQLTEVEDGSLNPMDGESIATVEINFCTFDNSELREGFEDTDSLLETLRIMLLENRVLTGFAIKAPLHVQRILETAHPLYYGSITARYNIPQPQNVDCAEITDPILRAILLEEAP